MIYVIFAKSTDDRKSLFTDHCVSRYVITVDKKAWHRHDYWYCTVPSRNIVHPSSLVLLT